MLDSLLILLFFHFLFSSFNNLGWIGFGVPDWQGFQRFNGSTREFYGLWAYCQDQVGLYGTVCQRWPNAEDQLFNGTRPAFIRTTQGLITTGMILLSLGLFIAIISIVLPMLAYIAAIFAFLAVVFLVIGLPIFGRQSNDLSEARGDAIHNKRYGFWLMVPTIALEALAILLFLGAAILYRAFGFGNLATKSLNSRSYGGQRVLGPANVWLPTPYRTTSRLYNADPMQSNSYPYDALSGQSSVPGLLSEYLARYSQQPYVSVGVPQLRSGVLAQSPVARALAPQLLSNLVPAYNRMEASERSSYPPIINLMGQTIIGPIMPTN
jgi:hypothetical protein